jgi:hypothetical protein
VPYDLVTRAIEVKDAADVELWTHPSVEREAATLRGTVYISTHLVVDVLVASHDIHTA